MFKTTNRCPPAMIRFGSIAIGPTAAAGVVIVGMATAQPLSTKPTLHTPDAIAPAVLPYLACLYAERGLPLLHASDGTQVPFDKNGQDCSAARAKAAVEAARLLEKNPAPSGLSAKDFIDQTLADMDYYVASLPMAGAAEQPAEKAVVGIPVTIEDEVQPAYAAYDDCLKTQVSNTPITSATIMAKFRAAMSVCAGVRGYSIQQATKALAAKAWDEPTRARAAESTFAKVDESWLAMGRQYQQVLANREAAAKSKAVGGQRGR